jgi:hypothetical protein
VVFRSIAICSSDSIAGDPDEQDRGGNEARHDQHPVLALETEKGKTLDEKLHRCRPFLGRTGVLTVEMNYFYISR